MDGPDVPPVPSQTRELSPAATPLSHGHDVNNTQLVGQSETRRSELPLCQRAYSERLTIAYDLGRRMHRIAIWLGSIVFGLTGAALCVYLVYVGLDEADKLASVLGMAVAMAALFVTIGSLIGRTGHRPATSAPDLPGSQRAARDIDVKVNGANSGVIVAGDNNRVDHREVGKEQ